jgi:hypothetical protein
VDAFAAGRLSRTLDPFHSAAYFVPEANEKFGATGMGRRMAYFASQSAPMGASRLAYAPWETVPDDQADEVGKVAKVVREAVQSAGLFPSGAFGARFGQHR